MLKVLLFHFSPSPLLLLLLSSFFSPFHFIFFQLISRSIFPTKIKFLENGGVQVVMGRAGRWLRGLLGGKKSSPPPPSPEQLQKPTRRWGFGKSFREKRVLHPPPPPPRQAPPLEEEEEEEEELQSKRAIAVAAATAAVAEAAVAAAHAAAVVVRLTSSGRRAGKREEWAAVKIQATFRAYLARRALRALRGLVKLQALVRGNIVRKQAAETLRCMQALVRVQARARACRALRADRNCHSNGSQTHPSPPTPEKYELVRMKSPSQNLKRNSSQVTSATRIQDQVQAQSSGWNWLDRWMEERYWDLVEPAVPGAVATVAPPDDEKNAKILEVDTGKPQLNHRRKGSCRHHSCSTTAASDQNTRSFNTTMMPDSPSKDSTVAQHSVRSPSSVDMQCPSPLRFPIIDNGDYGESPQFFSASSSRPGSSRRGPFTPGKSECSRSLFSAYSDYPNYMANTESSRAKVRSQSAPKQRPEFEKLGSVRRVSGNGLTLLSAGSSTTQKSSTLHSKFANKGYPGSGRLDRLGMPIRS
ncbi:putative protein IQ-DOMAIN 1 [Iris pallida]|uniref:DUF4005 domain-containing protein n=1 Tax=Iris pallida TaxID=29817 RepID=A0AAX6FW93_IRIPA|nr:putative protein IQ-DOMAIN 1 [Iris pallida]